MDLRKFELFSIKTLYNYCSCMISESSFVRTPLRRSHSDGHTLPKDAHIFRTASLTMVAINEGSCLQARELNLTTFGEIHITGVNGVVRWPNTTMLMCVLP